jgi:hypothetical protein
MAFNLLILGISLVSCFVGAFSGSLFFQLLIISLGGVFCHYLNGINRSTISVDPFDYFGGAFISTLSSLSACVLAVFGIVQSGDIDGLNYMVAGSAFASGYCADSMLNKSPSLQDRGEPWKTRPK